VQQNMEVAAVNYEARAHGLFNRISVLEALRLCPALVLVRGDNAVDGMQRYRRAAHGVLRVVMDALTDILPARLQATWSGRPVETPSFDDIFVRFDSAMGEAWARHAPAAVGLHAPLHRAASAWAQHVRAEILRQERLTCSAGVGASKLLAMLATKTNKPNGQHCVEPAEEEAFFAAAKIARLKGAGLRGLAPSTRAALVERLGEEARVCGLPGREVLQAWVGAEQAAAVQRLVEARCDTSTVNAYALPKSISVELCVRPSNYEPCTAREAVEQGFATLAHMLLGRADEDRLVFGERVAATVTAKWKEFGNKAKHVHQRSEHLEDSMRAPCARRPCPAEEDAGVVSAGGASQGLSVRDLGATAFRLFSQAHPRGGAPFAVSRLVLVLHYRDDDEPRAGPGAKPGRSAGGDAGELFAAGQGGFHTGGVGRKQDGGVGSLKRKRGAVGKTEVEGSASVQRTIVDMFRQRC